MKRIITTISAVFVIQLISFSEGLQAYFSYNSFKTIENKPFIETYLTIIGNTAIFNPNENGKLQSSVEITIIFSKDNKVENFKKYVLKSPEVEQSTINFPNFIDQQRFTLQNGIYNLELKILDFSSKTDTFQYHDIVSINFGNENIELSGIQFIESYQSTVEQSILSKSGYDLIPYVSSYYPKNIENLIFYIEIYNSDKVIKPDDQFMIRYFIISAETEKPLSDYQKNTKQKPKSVNVLLAKLSIKDLSTGNYYLVVELINHENQLLATKKNFFQRNNPNVGYEMKDLFTLNVENTFISGISDTDTLKDYIKCTLPISEIAERSFAENVLKNNNVDMMKKYFYNFWLKRNSNDPESEWLFYKKQVNLVNRFYSTQIKKGYETDRGRVFLQYGSPNEIAQYSYERSRYPYEIWHYYKIKDQINKIFVFSNREVVENEYALIHSDARGEIYNKFWESSLGFSDPNSFFNSENQNFKRLDIFDNSPMYIPK